jgi:hypothetical protein
VIVASKTGTGSAFGREGVLRFQFASRPPISRLSFISIKPMSSELPPEEDRPGVPIAPPLLFVLPILASLAFEWFVPTCFVHGAVRWTLGALFFGAGIALNIGGFITRSVPALILSRSIRARGSSHTGFIASPVTQCMSVSLCGRLGWRSWSILRGCSSPCQIGLVLIDRIVIALRRTTLERKFGDEYLNYKRRVWRWI